LSEAVREQYRDDSNLQARIALHSRFSTNPEGWTRWLFDRVAPTPGARVLEVGCGPAGLWAENLDRLDPSWSLTLTDSSPGMIDAARAALGDRADYVVADVQELPFADESYDVVLANHMLYHVPDRPCALGARVLVPGGAFHASTNGRGHMLELRELVGPEWGFNRHTEDFGLETGIGQLAALFADVSVEVHENDLSVTEVEPVLAYVRSSLSYGDGSLDRVREAVEAAIAREGRFRIRKVQGVLHGRKP